jgi:hypothetical protein
MWLMPDESVTSLNQTGPLFVSNPILGDELDSFISPLGFPVLVCPHPIAKMNDAHASLHAIPTMV